MSFTDTLTINDAQATPVAHVFTLVDRGAGYSKRVDSGSGESSVEPQVMVIKHSTSGSGASIVDRHLLQFSETVLDSAGRPQVVTANLTLAVPRSTVITNQKIKDQLRYISNLYNAVATFSDQFARGES